MTRLDAAGRLERLLAGFEPRFRKEFLEMVAGIKSVSTLKALTTLLTEGRIEEALSVIDRAGARLGALSSETYTVTGRSTAGAIRRATGEIVVDFDTVNARAVREMQENQLRLIREFGEQQRRATREALTDGIRRGANPREQARAFRQSIGLTQKQTQAVNNYRNLLENLDRGALQRKLRDGRFDGAVRRAIREGKPLTKTQVDRMVGRYAERSLKHRSEVIARTESLRSVHQGNREMFRQAIDNGVLASDQLVQIWNTAADERVRSSHATMNGQERPMDVPFTSGAGNSLAHPGDPDAPGSETIQCRCVVATRIASVSELQGVTSVQVIG